MKILDSSVEAGVVPGQIIVRTTIQIEDEDGADSEETDLGEGPTGGAIPDRIVQELMSSSPRPLSLAELQQFVGANPGTVARQAWTLATNAADLQRRLRGWVVSAGRGQYALSAAAQTRLGQRAFNKAQIEGSSPALREFADGVAFWNSHRNWPKDLHNADYQRWSRENPRGNFTMEWWHPFLKTLQGWIATRPVSGRELTARFIDAAPKLTEAWRTSCEPFSDSDISIVAWEEVSAFPEAVAAIKPTLTPSAVFTSKFCHFLLPRIFPVVDNEALGNAWPSYEQYFKFVQKEWAETDRTTRTELTAALTALIQVDGTEVFDGFPIANKVVELRLMGRKHPHPISIG